MLLFIVGFAIVAGLVPPPAPSDGAQKVARFYAEHADRIRAGLVLTMIAGALTAPFVAAITVQMRRIEGEFSPFAYTQLGTGMLGVLFFVLPVMIMQAAVFRTDRNPESILAIHDIAWIMTPSSGATMPEDMTAITKLGAPLALGFAIFGPQNTKLYGWPTWLSRS